MQYSFDEIHTLNLLSDNPDYSKRFNTPADLKIMTAVILFVVTAAVTCAILFKVDKIVPAQGVLETQARLFEVRTPQQGFVHEVRVQEGMAVDAGDVLVTFDTEQVDREIDRLRQELNTLSRSIWTDYYQISAWLDGATQRSLSEALASLPDPVTPLGYRRYLERALSHSLASIDQSIQGLETRQATLDRQIRWLDETIAMEQSEWERLDRLRAQGIESRTSVEQQSRRLLELQSNRESLASDLANTRTEQDKLLLDRETVRDEFILERLLRLQDQVDRYHQAHSRLASQRREQQDMTIRAPFAAVVDEVMALGRHEVVEAGMPLVRLRPEFDREDLQIDIQIPSNYAIWVSPGMEFRASSRGNNPDDHGRLHGIVDFVSKSSEEMEGNRIYRMTGTLTRVEVTNPETFLRPGLQLSVEIKAGQRRLINYLFDPFTKHLRTALSEPS
ncbi:MAG: HlyD family efflux transporter periplasmic adaptor subunit [Saccharospirillum sp.]